MLDGGAGRRRHAERTEKKNGERGAEVGGRRLLFNGSVARAERKKGAGGSQGSALHGGENGEERGGPSRSVGQLGGRHRPTAGRHGRRCCRAIGEGGGA
jgi:hypothetical protein